MKKLLTIILMLVLAITLTGCSNVASSNLPQSILEELNKSEVDKLQEGLEELQYIADYNRLKEYSIRHNLDNSYIDFNYTLQKDIYTLIEVIYCESGCVIIEINESFTSDEFSDKLFELIKNRSWKYEIRRKTCREDKDNIKAR